MLKNLQFGFTKKSYFKQSVKEFIIEPILRTIQFQMVLRKNQFQDDIRGQYNRATKGSIESVIIW